MLTILHTSINIFQSVEFISDRVIFEFSWKIIFDQ